MNLVGDQFGNWIFRKTAQRNGRNRVEAIVAASFHFFSREIQFREEKAEKELAPLLKLKFPRTKKPDPLFFFVKPKCDY